MAVGFRVNSTHLREDENAISPVHSQFVDRHRHPMTPNTINKETTPLQQPLVNGSKTVKQSGGGKNGLTLTALSISTPNLLPISKVCVTVFIQDPLIICFVEKEEERGRPRDDSAIRHPSGTPSISRHRRLEATPITCNVFIFLI